MGLPLYIAPVESDLRNKGSANRNSPTHGPNRIRRARRSTEALVESRRRAIMTATATATIPRPGDITESQRETLRAQFQAQQQLLDQVNRRRTEELQSHNNLRSRVQIYGSPGAHPSQPQGATPDAAHPSRESLLQRFYDRLRDHEQTNGLSSLGRDGNTAIANSTASPSAPAAANPATVSSSNAASASPRPSANVRVTTASGTGGLRDEHRLWYEYIISRSRNQASADLRERNGREGASAAMTAAIMDNMGGNDEEAGRNLLATLDRRWMDLPSLGSTTSQPNRSHRRPRATVEQYGAEGMPSSSDWDMGTDSARLSHPTSRRVSSLRRVMNASATSRRPTVGWSDNNNRESSRSRESSQSRVFGDTRQISSAGNRSLSNHDWMVGYLDINGDRRLAPRDERRRRERSFMVDGIISPPQEDGWGTPVDSMDGLGDRRRSLSPEGDSAWDTLLTTLTPDPQPPSVSTSFASTSSALAAAAEGQPTWVSSSQPTTTQTPVVAALPAVPSPVSRSRDDDENGTNESTPIPNLVETAHTPAWFTHEPTFLAGNASSGTTSAGTSQPVRSPFTVVSVDADTADESAVMFESGVEGEAPCEDSEMDEGVQRDGEDEDAAYDEEEQGEEEARAFFMGMTDGPSTGGDRSMRSSFGGVRAGNSQGANNGANSNNSNSQETLDILGIGGMQHIVRSLARREDIPDEWWAEAGLSRTLAREASS
ncbi:hypothetical protein SBRCBS47491_007647 [Sporothrix bragantina]|uniref:Uncharacterized protein n=1 Tax=Sporothrix bragantina TaxID=671064 RepID=A0ABP0CEV3_9PEZI